MTTPLEYLNKQTDRLQSMMAYTIPHIQRIFFDAAVRTFDHPYFGRQSAGKTDSHQKSDILMSSLYLGLSPLAGSRLEIADQACERVAFLLCNPGTIHNSFESQQYLDDVHRHILEASNSMSIVQDYISQMAYYENQELRHIDLPDIKEEKEGIHEKCKEIFNSTQTALQSYKMAQDSYNKQLRFSPADSDLWQPREKKELKECFGIIASNLCVLNIAAMDEYIQYLYQVASILFCIDNAAMFDDAGMNERKHMLQRAGSDILSNLNAMPVKALHYADEARTHLKM